MMIGNHYQPNNKINTSIKSSNHQKKRKMKKILSFLLLSIGLCLITNAQTVTLLKPNESYKAPPDAEMVVMNKYQFGSYHYTASKYDTLKTNYLKLDNILSQKESIELELVKKYDYLFNEKQELTTTYENSYKRLNNTVNDCLSENKQLQVNYLKLEQKSKRVKRWRNWFMGTSVCFGTIIILSIVK